MAFDYRRYTMSSKIHKQILDVVDNVVLIGGVVGYAVTRNYYEPVYNYGYVPPPPVVVQQPMRSVCTPWTETQHADGTITRTRTCQ